MTTDPKPDTVFTGIVDIHHADGSYDLDDVVRGGVAALWHKATEGTTYHDEAFPQAMDRARAAGLLRGAYHFASGASAPETQAEEFVSTVRALAHDTSDVLLALDLEGSLDNPKTMKTEDAARFIVRVEELTGATPVLYAGLSKLRERCAHASPYVLQVFGRTRLWLAAYGPDPLTLVPPAPWAAWWLQQYTNGNDGPRDRVRFPRRTKGFTREAQDRSCFRGTVAELRERWADWGRT